MIYDNDAAATSYTSNVAAVTIITYRNTYRTIWRCLW